MTSPFLAADLAAGLPATAQVHANLTAPALVAHALRRRGGRLSADGAPTVRTGRQTGRSVQDAAYGRAAQDLARRVEATFGASVGDDARSAAIRAAA